MSATNKENTKTERGKVGKSNVVDKYNLRDFFKG